MSGGRRARADESAHRINDAARLLEMGLKVSDVIVKLSRQYGVSSRQARRYLERAQKVGTVEVPGPKLVFTVKLPEALAQRIREYAATSQRTLSSLVAQALEEFLSKARSGPEGG